MNAENARTKYGLSEKECETYDKVYDKLLEYFYKASEKYEVVAVMLYGSQNYKLDTENSDIDAKAIVLPTFENFLKTKAPISTDLDFGTDGKLDVKDVRVMFECFKKQNINFVELLFSDYIVYNKKYTSEIHDLLDMKHRVAHYNSFSAINCMRGMAHEKFKALKHPYPTITHKIEKFGYDPKQLRHILRLEEFMKRYIAGESYKDCLVSENSKFLIDVKNGVYPLSDAETWAKESLSVIDVTRDEFMNNNKPNVDKWVVNELDNITVSMFKKYFKEQLV